MNTIKTANELTGRGTGILFLSGFGTLWLALGFYATEQLRPLIIAALAAGILIFVSGALRLFRAAKRWPTVPDDPAVSRAFNQINAGQWIAVGVVAFTLSKLHLSAYVLNAVTAIVGLHFFPLARIFRLPLHYLVGAVMVLWAAATLCFVSHDSLQGIDALGTGAILWSYSALMLVRALRAIELSSESTIR